MLPTLAWPVEGSRRIPGWIYTDPAIYAREQERIFGGRSWNYIGLTSEIPRAGDFLQTYVGEHPVVAVRDRDGRIRVFVNRCTHRGSQFCLEPRGHANSSYVPIISGRSSWMAGSKSVPFSRGIRGKGGMSECFDPSRHGLEQLTVTERHGVILASYANDVEPIEEYLGPTILSYFDRVCDGRPLEVIGTMRHRLAANWKLQVENLKDTAHAALMHAFFVKFGIWRNDQNTEIKVGAHGASSVLVSTGSFRSVGSNEAITPDFDLEDKRMVTYQPEFEHGSTAILTIWPNLIILQNMNSSGHAACQTRWPERLHQILDFLWL